MSASDARRGKQVGVVSEYARLLFALESVKMVPVLTFRGREG
jgi:hypothetical protein